MKFILFIFLFIFMCSCFQHSQLIQKSGLDVKFPDRKKWKSRAISENGGIWGSNSTLKCYRLTDSEVDVKWMVIKHTWLHHTDWIEKTKIIIDENVYTFNRIDYKTNKIGNAEILLILPKSEFFKSINNTKLPIRIDFIGDNFSKSVHYFEDAIAQINQFYNKTY